MRRISWWPLAAALVSCVPPSEPADPAPEAPPEPQDENGIPWAPGEAPESAAESAREVTPYEKNEQVPPSYYEEDGITQASSSPACMGKAPPSLRAAVQSRTTETHACESRMPQEKAGASGDVKWSFRVQENGDVTDLKVLVDTLKVPEVTTCAEEVLQKSFKETPPLGGCAAFVIPLHIESKLIPAEESPEGTPGSSDAPLTSQGASESQDASKSQPISKENEAE